MKRILVVSIVFSILLLGCAKMTVNSYMKATMGGNDTAKYVTDNFEDDVVAPYKVLNYKILRTIPNKYEGIDLGKTVFVEVTFKSKAGGLLPKIIEFSVTNDLRIIGVE